MFLECVVNRLRSTCYQKLTNSKTTQEQNCSGTSGTMIERSNMNTRGSKGKLEIYSRPLGTSSAHEAVNCGCRFSSQPSREKSYGTHE